MFIITPRVTISCIFKCPEPKTTAFGGVATGSMNAQEAATAAPTISPKGWILISKAKGANTGKSIAVVAKFDVISVKKFTDVINDTLGEMLRVPQLASFCLTSALSTINDFVSNKKSTSL